MLNLSAPVNQLGYGVVGLNLALALERLGAGPCLWPLGPVECPPEHQPAVRGMLARQNAFSSRSPSLRVWHQFDLAQHVGKGPHCAYPFFELNRLKPRERHHLASQDLVFAPSQWAKKIILSETRLRGDQVAVAVPGVDRSVFHENAAPLDLGLDPGATVFLAVGKWELRKGHDVLALAFQKAFDRGENVRLVLNCFNPCLPSHDALARYNREWCEYYQGLLGGRAVILSERLASQSDVAALMRAADCAVLPSRGEGFGLEGLEALSCGVHLITTDYSSHPEYATEENSLLIRPGGLEPAHDGVWFDADDPAWGGAPGEWMRFGDDEVDQLVDHLRSVHRRKRGGELSPNLAGVEAAKKLSWDATARAALSAVGAGAGAGAGAGP